MGTRHVENKSRAQAALDLLDEMLLNVVTQSLTQTDQRRKIKRTFIEVLGYSSTFQCHVLGSGWAAHAFDYDQREKWISTPRHEGNTPTAPALMTVGKRIKDFFAGETQVNERGRLISNADLFHHSVPPFVIHITDGRPNDWDDRLADAPDCRRAASYIKELDTPGRYNHPILFNVVVGDISQQVLYPLDNELDSTFSKPKHADLRFACQLASMLPDPLVRACLDRGMSKHNLRLGSFGALINAPATAIVDLLAIGSGLIRDD